MAMRLEAPQVELTQTSRRSEPRRGLRVQRSMAENGQARPDVGMDRRHTIGDHAALVRRTDISAGMDGLRASCGTTCATLFHDEMHRENARKIRQVRVVAVDFGIRADRGSRTPILAEI